MDKESFKRFPAALTSCKHIDIGIKCRFRLNLPALRLIPCNAKFFTLDSNLDNKLLRIHFKSTPHLNCGTLCKDEMEIPSLINVTLPDTWKSKYIKSDIYQLHRDKRNPAIWYICFGNIHLIKKGIPLHWESNNLICYAVKEMPMINMFKYDYLSKTGIHVISSCIHYFKIHMEMLGYPKYVKYINENGNWYFYFNNNEGNKIYNKLNDIKSSISGKIVNLISDTLQLQWGDNHKIPIRLANTEVNNKFLLIK